jgi:hypothetical protein
MIVRTRAMLILAVAAAVVSWFAVPAQSQGVGSIGGRKNGGPSTPPKIDTGPPVDEKAYKAALDRIPEPTRKYDPWGVARPTEPAKPTKKSN